MDYGKIISLVYSARRFALDRRLQSHVELKGKADFVTKADFIVSEYIKEGLKEIAPGYAFVTEEEQTHSSAPRRFILDPIDGTANLVRGYNMSTISLGLYEEGEPTFGVVYNPFSGELFFAIKGKGAHLFQARSGIRRLLTIGVENYKDNLLKASSLGVENAVIEFGAGSTAKDFADKIFPVMQTIFKETQDFRRTCSTALAICYIAAGRIDGYFEKKIKPWDYAAASLILTEAGGKLSCWDASPLPYDGASTIVAANGKVYGYLLGKLGELL